TSKSARAPPKRPPRRRPRPTPRSRRRKRPDIYFGVISIRASVARPNLRGLKPWRFFFGLTLLFWSLLSPAQAQSGPTKGRDYLEVPQFQPAGNTVQVIEFFWYACPNCYALEPRLARWAAALPADVTFRRVPAVPNAQ